MYIYIYIYIYIYVCIYMYVYIYNSNNNGGNVINSKNRTKIYKDRAEKQYKTNRRGKDN